MAEQPRYPRSNAPELVAGIHSSWNALRIEVDRRLRIALDEEAALGVRLQAAAWLAFVTEVAATLDDGAAARHAHTPRAE